MTTKQSEQSRDHLQVEWLLFFPQWKCTIAGQKLRNLAIRVFKNYGRNEMKGKERGIYSRSFFWKKRTAKNVRASTFLWGWAILYAGCQALFVFMLCNCANLLCINPGLVKSCYSGPSYAMCCVNLGKSSLFGNFGHKLGDRILSQGFVLVPTLCRLGELC